VTRNLRPALLILLLSAAGLGVPAGFAQSKGTAKKKTSTASKASSSTPSAASKSATKSSPKASSSKTTTTKASPAGKKTTGSSATAKSSARGGSSRTAGKSSRGSRRQPGQKAPTSDRVSEIQAALARDGSFSAMPNGKWDDETTQAMRRFQAAHGLNPSGKLDALSLQKLGLGSQTAGVAAPTPPPGAVSRLTSSTVSPSTSAETARRQ
jgi:peptidoglycan hydrolase-like protein with peptidoglycan-binding domain